LTKVKIRSRLVYHKSSSSISSEYWNNKNKNDVYKLSLNVQSSLGLDPSVCHDLADYVINSKGRCFSYHYTPQNYSAYENEISVFPYVRSEDFVRFGSRFVSDSYLGCAKDGYIRSSSSDFGFSLRRFRKV
jgi:hypothetical protein